MKTIYYETRAYDPEALALLKEHGEVVIASPEDDRSERARQCGAHALIIGGTWEITGELLDRLPLVEVVARTGIGYDKVDVSAATARGVAVVYTPDGPTEATAELTVLLLLALARRFPHIIQAAAEVRFAWDPQLEGVELAGKTAGLVGLGRIGRRVAEICAHGLHMRVIAYDPYVSPETALAVGATLVNDLDMVFSQADFVSLHVPPSPATYHLVDARRLALMKPTAFLVNCARGALVEEKALIEALRSGRLAGAGLDVFDPEPPAKDNPLLHLPNVIATPHFGGFTREGVRGMCVGAAQQVVDVFHNRRPEHLLNPEVWDAPHRRSRPSH